MKEQVIALLATVLAVVVPLVRSYIQTRFPYRWEQVVNLASVAVNAAEKLGADNPGTSGEAKYAFAADMLVTAAKRFDIRLKQDEVIGLIHDALRTLQQVESMSKPIGFAA